MNGMEKILKRIIQYEHIIEGIFVLIMAMYPLRHISIGLDLWDTGYNYANFQYMGMEHMDSMWLFSTYLANVVGHFLTLLPMGHTLVGMNFYTGLFVSILALMGYFFCTRVLQMPKWVAFLGEFIAISFCWSPTAVLYNYLTYVLFLSGVILLYLGLSREKMWFLFAAGVCLGTNVLVRFSNLPEAAMIVAVWAYAFIVGRETKQGAWARGLRHTLWCLFGYLSALLVLLGFIQLRYGLDEYVAGIQRLFAMTDNATDYKASSMLMGVVGTYVEELYWVIRILVIVGIGLVGCAVSGYLVRYVKPVAKRPGLQKVFEVVCRFACVALALAMLYWMYFVAKLCSFYFYSYDPIWHPGVLFLMLTMLLAVIRIFHRGATKEERLISGIVLLVVLLTSLGSNAGVYSSFNNLFVAAPYTLWQCSRFVCKVKVWEFKRLVVNPFPVKCVLVAFLAMCLFQFGMFGVKFVFVEATGAQNVTAQLENNEVLNGVKMSPERAEWLGELSAYANENGLQGREVILYGDIPAVSFYLQMPSVFNPWSDLASYSAVQMEKELTALADAYAGGEQEKPVIILEQHYAAYLEEAALSLTEEERLALEQDKKWLLLVEFIEQNGYEPTFTNAKFVVLQ